MSSKKYDFSGWATKNDLKCSDGRTIRRNAFAENDGQTVPLVWNHQHNDPANVLGHALLENRSNGVYAYCTLNDSPAGQNTKELIRHGDIESLSIYANQLTQDSQMNVLHGTIRELSVVLAGANPGAYIDNIMLHGYEMDDEAIIYNDEGGLSLAQSEDGIQEENQNEEDENMSNELSHAEKEETVQDVIDSMNEKQKKVLYALVGAAVENQKEDDADMKQNVFDRDEENQENVISHSDMEAVIMDAKRYGSLRDSALAHGITDIEFLFPEARLMNNPPEFISRGMSWVPKVMGAVSHTPFSRIKSQFANITEEDARAKGYIKGNKKKDEVFGLLKRTTTPTTIYKKQKLDRDDVIDIVDFDVVAWLKAEMRMMLDEEIARAILISDGRETASDDKINEQNIRPIVKDDELYNIRCIVKSSDTDTEDVRAKKTIRAIIKSRKDYKGSGEPTYYTTEDSLTDMLLLEDNTGRVIYDTVDKLAKVLRVKEIVTVPVMEGAKAGDADGKKPVLGILVNLKDYNVGADKGGAINLFDDFDINYNQQKYLIETRCSGALIKPYSAISVLLDTTP